jgi:hypothetical protein
MPLTRSGCYVRVPHTSARMGCWRSSPDVESLTARLLRERWWHFRLAHVGYFSEATLTQAANAGLRVVSRRRPKWFLPVGYLAERGWAYLPLKHLNGAIQRVPAWRCYTSGSSL